MFCIISVISCFFYNCKNKKENLSEHPKCDNSILFWLKYYKMLTFKIASEFYQRRSCVTVTVKLLNCPITLLTIACCFKLYNLSFSSFFFYLRHNFLLMSYVCIFHNVICMYIAEIYSNLSSCLSSSICKD